MASTESQAGVASSVDRTDVRDRPRGHSARNAASSILLALSLLLAAMIYQPWRPVPLPVADWGELLRILPADRSAATSYQRLTETFRKHGRHQPVQMGAMAAQWAAFGTDTVRWRMTRFVVVSLIVIGSYLLARLLGVGSVGAAIAVSLFVVGSMAHQLWYLLQIGEPTGLMFLLAAALVAARYRSTTRPLLAAVAMTALLVGSVLSKEPFLAAVPFVLLLAVRPSNQESLRRVARQRRVIGLVTAVSLGLLVTSIIPIVAGRGVSADASYAAQYGVQSITSGGLGNVAAAMLLPVTRVVFFPANVVFIIVLLSGAVVALRRGGRDAAWLMAAGLSAPLLGAALYSRWPAVEGYYGAAYLPGLALVFGLALGQASLHRRPLVQGVVAIGVLVLIAYGGLFAWENARAYAAARDVDNATAAHIAALRGVSRVMVTVPAPSPRDHFGKAFIDYVHGLHDVDRAAAPDAPCGAGRQTAPTPARTAVVVFSLLCPLDDVPPSAWRISTGYTILDWKSLGAVQRRIEAAVWTAD
jgi:hypothetical protein